MKRQVKKKNCSDFEFEFVAITLSETSNLNDLKFGQDDLVELTLG